MLLETIKLSATRNTTIRLAANVQATLDGRPVRRSAIGGRFFMADANTLQVRLDSSAILRDQELTLTPASTVVIDGTRTLESVSKIKFVGWDMQILSDEDPRQKETVKQLNAQVQALTEQENRLRQQLLERQNSIRQLEQSNQTEQQRITQLSTTAASLQQQKQQLEQSNQAEQQHITQLSATAAALQNQKAQLTTANGTLTQLENTLQQVNGQLADVKQRETELNQAVIRTTQEHKIVAAAIRKLEEDRAQASAAFEALKQQENQLNADLKKYSPAVLANLEATIETLTQQFAASEEQWTNLSGEKRVWEKRLEDQTQTNEQLTQEIAQQPEELRLLQEAHEDLTRRLNETIHAQEMCSVEKQQALQEQIDEQEPIAQKLTEQYQTLQQRADELLQTITELQQNKDAALLALYPQFTSGLDYVMRSVGGMNAEMESLYEDAIAFDKHVQTCANRMEYLKEWYHVDQTPLQKLQERLGTMTPSENEQLLKTMDPANINRVRDLFDAAQDALTELDNILKAVIKAAQHDEKFMNLKATTNEQHARQEMKR